MDDLTKRDTTGLHYAPYGIARAARTMCNDRAIIVELKNWNTARKVALDVIAWLGVVKRDYPPIIVEWQKVPGYGWRFILNNDRDFDYGDFDSAADTATNDYRYRWIARQTPTY